MSRRRPANWRSSSGWWSWELTSTRAAGSLFHEHSDGLVQADLNARGGIRDSSALDLAASDGHVEIVRYLLSCGPELDVSEPTRNPLFSAIRGGHSEVAKLLIEAGIDTNVKYTGGSMKGTGALELARQWGRNDIVVLLGGTPELPQITEAAPSRKDRMAVRDGADAAAQMLGLTGAETPEGVVQKIQQFLEDFAAGATENPLGDNAAVALGALWGNAICDAYGWQWIVPKHGRWRSLGVADPERSYLALPFDFFHKLMNDDPEGETPGPLVRFHAIGASHLPVSDPKTYTVITS